MDPDATFRTMLGADSTKERRRAAHDLIEWLDKGGYAPLGHTEISARHTAMTVLNQTHPK